MQFLVGHSLGGLSVRMFADQYPEQVAGMVLIEASDPDAWKRLDRPETIPDVDSSFSAALDQVRNAKGIGHKPLMIVLGSAGDGATPALRDLWAAIVQVVQAARSGSSGR